MVREGIDQVKALKKSAKCTKEICEVKKKFILKMTSKLEDPNTAQKAYWTILNHLPYNKKIPAIPALLADDKVHSDLCEKANLFNNFLDQYVHL